MRWTASNVTVPNFFLFLFKVFRLMGGCQWGTVVDFKGLALMGGVKLKVKLN